MPERGESIETLAQRRGFLLQATVGLKEAQARTAPMLSALTIVGLLKHVADTEERWMDFALRGAVAFADVGVYESDVDWVAVAAESAGNGGDWSDGEWVDNRFTVADDVTLDALRAHLVEVAARTEEILLGEAGL